MPFLSLGKFHASRARGSVNECISRHAAFVPPSQVLSHMYSTSKIARQAEGVSRILSILQLGFGPFP